VAGFEILEHTADVGLRARGETLEEVFEQATLGLLDILDCFQPEDGLETRIEVKAPDLGGLLVDWLTEVLYLQETHDAIVAAVAVDHVDATSASGTVRLSARGNRQLGTAVKAITYHQLTVTRAGTGWLAEVYVDV
jgi:SHS2 domain-containing protein